MERSTRKYGLLNLLVLLVIGAAGFFVARTTNSVAGQISVIFLGIGMLVVAVSWFQMRLEETERLEKLEFEELVKSKSGSTLFESKDAEVFPAQRSREQFEKFFVPGFTALLLVIEIAGAVLLWRWFAKRPLLVPMQQPTISLAFFALFALVLFLIGKFSATIARLENHRLLRPSASSLLLGAYLCAVVAIGGAIVWFGYVKADFYVAEILSGLLALVAMETLINLILEIYRPRVKGKIARPLYESRLVGLLGQPEGLFTTAAQTLDYQFGFKVSDTWAFNMITEKLPGFVLGLVVAAILSSCVFFLEPGEQALLERFGHSVTTNTTLGPGAHLKFPWPIDKIYRFNVGEVKSFNVGFTLDPKLANQTTVLWTVPHYKEELPFLVAARNEQSTFETNQTDAAQSVPVNLLDAGIPVQFRIKDIHAWAYGHEDAQALLEQLATREVVRYLASVDLLDIMSVGRANAAEELKKNIQASANQLNLGAEILFVGLQDIHPPTTVASAFEAVNGAEQEVQTKILTAEGATNAIVLLAQAKAIETTNGASGDAIRVTTTATARAARFTNQMAAYQAAPEVYPRLLFVQTIASAAANTRNYVIGATNTHRVTQLDLKESIANEMLNGIRVGSEKNP
jgi:membrane protease subunit HflK